MSQPVLLYLFIRFYVVIEELKYSVNEPPTQNISVKLYSFKFQETAIHCPTPALRPQQTST